MAGRNSAYSPLPQSNSDSEGSSEELHIAQENRVLKSQNVTSEKAFNEKKSNTINYKLLDTDGGIGATLIRFQPTVDEVSILKPNNKIEIFSTSRKLCFVFSLLLCVLTTVVFVWVLPCSEGVCFSSVAKQGLISWEQSFEGLELFGPISLFPNPLDNMQNLVFFMRKSLNSSKNIHTKSGLISLKGENGIEFWNITLNNEPTDINCNMFDANSDGVNDCLVFGTRFLKAIDSTSGAEIWDLFNSSKTGLTPELHDFPLLIYDLDGDNVKDLLAPCSLFNMKTNSLTAANLQNYLVIISGKTGQIINTPLQIKMCSAIHNLMFENSSVISYTCYNSTEKESLQTITLDELINSLTQTPPKKVNFNKLEFSYHHRKESNSISISGHKLLVDNQGRCPEDCNVLVSIKDESGGNLNSTVYTYKDKNTYCVMPVVLKPDSAGSLVLKFWKWQSKEKINDENYNHFSLKRMINFETDAKPNLNNGESKSKDLENEMLVDGGSGFQRFKRSTNGHYRSSAIKDRKESGDPYLHIISETILSVSFNESHPVVRNVTQNKIVQICKKLDTCKPDVQEQELSLLIADVNGDGKNELISYSSSYIHKTNKKSSETNENWKIRSLIKVITL